MKKLILALPAFVSLFLILIFIFSCTDSINEPTKNINKISSVLLEKGIEKHKIPLGFEPLDTVFSYEKGFPCGFMKVYGWIICEFAPKQGKKIGIWAANSSPTWSEYFNEYGFS